jgi:hypothetical protein
VPTYPVTVDPFARHDVMLTVSGGSAFAGWQLNMQKDAARPIAIAMNFFKTPLRIPIPRLN